MTLRQKIHVRRQLRKPSPEFPQIDDGFNRMWDDATIEEKTDVVKMYNKFYCNDGNELTLEKANQSFSGSRWITIKYTFGVEPV